MQHTNKEMDEMAIDIIKIIFKTPTNAFCIHIYICVLNAATTATQTATETTKCRMLMKKHTRNLK